MSEMPAMSDTTTNTLPAPANDDPWSAASAPAETAAPAADPWGASDAASTASSSADTDWLSNTAATDAAPTDWWSQMMHDGLPI